MAGQGRDVRREESLRRLKFEIAGELVPPIPGAERTEVPETRRPAGSGTAPGQDAAGGAPSFDRFKFELARELGVPLQKGYNGELSSRDAGRLGGKIGGQMVRRMIAMAEQQLST